MFPAAWVAGILGALALPAAPSFTLTVLLAIAALSALSIRSLRCVGLAGLGACYCLLQIQMHLADRLAPELAAQSRVISGVVAGSPFAGKDFLEFRLDSLDWDAAGPPPGTLRLRWYRDWPPLAAGETWRLETRLVPPWGRVNFQGDDPEKRLFAERIAATGSIRSGERLAAADPDAAGFGDLRTKLAAGIDRTVDDGERAAVIRALATADRSAMKQDDREVLMRTGTAHLLAISGLHVGLAAATGIWFGRGLLWIAPLARMGPVSYYLPFAAGLLTALTYSALANFGTSTQRALCMLLVTLAAIALPRRIQPWRAWILAMAAVLALDPFAALSPGFWLSFVAVAALIYVFSPRPGGRGWLRAPLLAQAGIGMVMLPLSVAFFHFFSPLGFAANLVAIPFVSLLVVPPVLAGIALAMCSETLAGGPWNLAALSIDALFRFLYWLDGLQGPLQTVAEPSFAKLALAMAGALILLLPRGLPWRWMGALLVVPLLLPRGERGLVDALEVEILDTGQGTAVIAQSGGQTLLYDAGPGDGGDHNLVAPVIAPALALRPGGEPDEVVISHGDLDHAGGLQTLLERYPGASYHARLQAPREGLQRCRRDDRLSRFPPSAEILHPSDGLPYLGNDSSCVVSLRAGHASMLLAGDIGGQVEARLLSEGIEPHRLLLVPHHGSNTSSTQAFIDRLAPAIAVSTNGRANRFGLPREDVRERYRRAGIRFLSTADCGALRITIEASGQLEAVSARRVRKGLWRYPPSPNCP